MLALLNERERFKRVNTGKESEFGKGVGIKGAMGREGGRGWRAENERRGNGWPGEARWGGGRKRQGQRREWKVGQELEEGMDGQERHVGGGGGGVVWTQEARSKEGMEGGSRARFIRLG